LKKNNKYLMLQAISNPAARHKFRSSDVDDSDDIDDASHFISAVCWKSESPTMLAASSQGTIKVLVLAP
jgi:E3 ubiquitin-protein ligase RFWD2